MTNTDDHIGNTSYSFRRLDLQDEHLLLNLCFQCPDYFSQVEGHPASFDTARDIFQVGPPGRSLDDKFIWGIFDPNGRLVGFTEIIRHYPRDGNWWIGLQLLLPECRRNGLGSQLYQFVESWIVTQNGSAIMLGVVESNIPALQFWQANGFKIEGVRLNQLTGTKYHTILIMKRQLKPSECSCEECRVLDQRESLVTPRLKLRTPNADDADLVLDYYARNREFLAPWNPERSASFYTRAYWTDQFSIWEDEKRRNRSVHWIFFERNQPESVMIGQCAFTNIVPAPFHAAYLGFSLDRSSEGKGFMFEALIETIHHAFSALNLHRIMANYMPENRRSEILLARLGFQKEGYARDYLFLAGAWQDHVLTSLIHSDWRR